VVRAASTGCAVLDPVGGRPCPSTSPTGSVATFVRPSASARTGQQRWGAVGVDPVEHVADADWAWMYETNVMGTLRVTRALLPALEASGDGHIVNIGSVAALDPYIGGAGYCGVKSALLAFSKILRMELLGKPIRVTEVDPGMVETEFSVVRFRGDTDRAAKVYDGVKPCTPDDVAECVAFAVTRPSHVNIDQIVVTARDQAGARMVHRRT
jgi:NADP-dependent 3-hydroxy acid dehydrogenase YdfG